MSTHGSEPHLSIVVPAYNEQFRIEPTLDEILRVCRGLKITFEVIVVDDGSHDETSKVVQRKQISNPEIKLITLPQNRGKGFAVRTGIQSANGTFVGFADADGSSPFTQITELMNALGHDYEVAIGSRALPSKETKVQTSLHRRLFGRVFNTAVNVFLVPGITDTQCGFKLFTKRAAHFLFSLQKSDGFSFDVEILFLAQRCGIKIIEVPINWHNVAGSKVNLLSDSVKMLIDTIRFRYVHSQITIADYPVNSK